MAAVAGRIGAAGDEGVRAEAGHIPALDGLRGLAVLWVILFHYVVVRSQRFDDPFIATIDALHPLAVVVRHGYLGVDLFFVLSGFLLALPWFARAERGAPAPSARAFYARRFWRIAPAYYVHLAVLFLLVLPLLKGIGYWRADLYVLAFNAFAHAGFVHNTTPLTSGSLGINGALWSLAVEAQYYVLLPLLAPLVVRAPRAAFLAAFSIAVAWQLGAKHGLDAVVAAQVALGTPWGWSEATVRQLLLTQLPSYLGHFAVGMLAGRAWVRWRSRPAPRGVRIGTALGAAAALAALFVVYGYLGPFLGEATWIVSPLALGAAFFALAANDRGRRGALLGAGPLAFVGRISYSAYLYHLPLLILWNTFVPAAGWGSILGYLAATLALAWASWRFVEAPLAARAQRDRLPTASAAPIAST